MAYSYIPVILSSAAILTIVMGIGVLFSYSEPSRQRNVFICAMLVWLYMLVSSALRQIDIVQNSDEIYGYMSNIAMLRGIPCLLSLTLYGVSVLFHKRYSSRAFILFCLPAIVAFFANIVTSVYLDIPLSYYYTSWESYMADSLSFYSIVRYLTTIILFLYLMFIAYSVYQLVPIYNRYLEDNESEERYNINWLYLYVFVLIALNAAGYVLSFSLNNVTLSTYNIVVIISFSILIYCVCSYRHFPDFDRVVLRWSWYGGWYRFVGNRYLHHSKSVAEQLQDNIFDDITNWIVETKQYEQIGFSMATIVEKYTVLNTRMLYEILKRRGHTFQSYIRVIRVREAIRMIGEDDGDLRFKEIYYKVGFSHYSSFARAFTTVVGVSPSKFNTPHTCDQ